MNYIQDDAFFYHTRIYYEDTDAGGVVYHANYYKLCERARTEWLRTLNIPGDVLIRQHQVHFVARRSSIEWRKPARLDDFLVIESRLTGIGKVRMVIRHTVRRDDIVLCTIDIELVCVNLEIVPTPFPKPLLDALPQAETIEEPNRKS